MHNTALIFWASLGRIYAWVICPFLAEMVPIVKALRDKILGFLGVFQGDVWCCKPTDFINEQRKYPNESTSSQHVAHVGGPHDGLDGYNSI